MGREAANPSFDTEPGNDREPGALPRHRAKEELIESRQRDHSQAFMFYGNHILFIGWLDLSSLVKEFGCFVRKKPIYGNKR